MLEILSDQLARASSIFEKISILNDLPKVEAFLVSHPYLRAFFAGLSPECEVALKQIIAIDQADRLFAGSPIDAEKLRDLLEKLIAIDHFYREIGGIAGYQAKILRLLKNASETIEKAERAARESCLLAFEKELFAPFQSGESSSLQEEVLQYHSPCFIDIAEEGEAVRKAVAFGLEGLPQMAEIYPLGGAADRLHLVEEKSGLELPAAKLPFAGKTLLEHLVRDLQAREYLYYQTYGKQLTTPIAIMTSHEKNNHAHVTQICERLHWFGRRRESIRFFTQPLVPAVDSNGNWCLMGPLKPLLKPGGHGAIWKLARDGGIFAWLEKEGRKKALIRQINNPIAGLDYGLLAFTGIGCKKEMIFGFASCPRLLQAAEGVNVLIETRKEVVLTNIEYCDFAKFGIEDRPLKEGEPYSRFSSNTNILFADLKALSQAVDACPFPGLLINLKKTSYTTESGEKKEESMARLESTMQNIADVFVEEKGPVLKTERTFVTYNRRHKTISTAKKAFVPGRALQETPENCFYDLLLAHRELLLECGFQLPPQRSLEEHLEKGPDFLFLYHPALGPLYSSIREKLQGGTLAACSELLLEIAHFKASNLKVQGSLQVMAEQVMGHVEGEILHYSDKVGRCILENVTVENRGVDWACSSPFWRMDLKRQESVKIILKGQSQFIARNIHLKGSHVFVVEDGRVMEI